MTTDRNKLLELAKEAGAFEGLADDDMIFPGGSDALERFAALVLSAAQAEREPVGEVKDNPDDIGTYVDLGEQLAPGTKLYVTPPSSDQVWNESAEHAAHQWETAHGFDKHGVAAFIRSLKRPSQAQEQECETCEGKGHYDERIGGESFSNPKADCPDCDGKGWNAKADVSASGAGDERVMTAPVPARPILYTDTVSGEQCCRDDMWAVTTAELNAISRAKQAAQPQVIERDALKARCEAIAEDEKACRNAYNNQYHKVRAEVGYDAWRGVWKWVVGCVLPSLLWKEFMDQPAAQSAQVPEGWKLVPLEATHGMHLAGETQWENTGHLAPDPSGMYRAMLPAAPQPDQGGDK